MQNCMAADDVCWADCSEREGETRQTEKDRLVWCGVWGGGREGGWMGGCQSQSQFCQRADTASGHEPLETRGRGLCGRTYLKNCTTYRKSKRSCRERLRWINQHLARSDRSTRL